jgi:hypothetical protein
MRISRISLLGKIQRSGFAPDCIIRQGVWLLRQSPERIVTGGEHCDTRFGDGIVSWLQLPGGGLHEGGMLPQHRVREVPPATP